MVALAPSRPPRLLNSQIVPNPQRLRVPIIRAGRFSAPTPATIQAAILAQASVTHYWKFDEASGDFADSKGSMTLTAAGTIAYRVTGTSGFAIQAGSDARAFNAGSPVDLSAPFTIYLVVNADPLDSIPLFDLSGAGGAQFEVITRTNNNLKILYTTDGSAYPINDLVAATIANSAWHDAMIVYTGSHLLVYLDGNTTPVFDKTIGLTAFTITSTYFLRDHGGGGSATGKYQHFATFSTALNTQQVSDFHNVLSDTTSPIYDDSSPAAIAADGQNLTINVVEARSQPLKSSEPVITATLSGSPVTLAGYGYSGSTITAVVSSAIVRQQQRLEISYDQASGGITDQVGNPLASFTSKLVTNNSTVPAITEAVIIEMSVASAKMAPFTCHMHAAYSTVAAGRLDEAEITWTCPTATAITISDPRNTSAGWDYRAKQRHYAAAFLLPVGTHTITATITATDGSSDSTTHDVTVVADARTDWYVSYVTGNDSTGDGLTDGTAWLTVGKAIAQLNLAPVAKRINAYALPGGHTYNETSLLQPVGATNGILQSYGGGTATIKYTGATSSSGFMTFAVSAGNENFIVQNLNFDSSDAAWNAALVPDVTGGSDTTAFYGATPPSLIGVLIWSGNTNLAFINCDFTSRFESLFNRSGGNGLFLADIQTDHCYRQGIVSNNAKQHMVIIGGTWKRSSQEHIMRFLIDDDYVAVAANHIETGLVVNETNSGNTKGVRYQSVNYGSFYDNETWDVGFNLNYLDHTSHDLIWEANHSKAVTVAFGHELMKGVQNVSFRRNVWNCGDFATALVSVNQNNSIYPAIATKNISLVKNTLTYGNTSVNSWIIDFIFDSGGFLWNATGITLNGNEIQYPDKQHGRVLHINATTDLASCSKNIYSAFTALKPMFRVGPSSGTFVDKTWADWIIAGFGTVTSEDQEDVDSTVLSTYPYAPAATSLKTAAVGLIGGSYIDFNGRADSAFAGAAGPASSGQSGRYFAIGMRIGL